MRCGTLKGSHIPGDGLCAAKPGVARREPTPTLRWSVYLLRCGDGTFYCGIARDVAVRMAMHEAGRGARYTRGRGPLQLLLTRRCHNQGNALRIELAVKRLKKSDKLALISAPERLANLARRALRRRTRR